MKQGRSEPAVHVHKPPQRHSVQEFMKARSYVAGSNNQASQMAKAAPTKVSSARKFAQGSTATPWNQIFALGRKLEEDCKLDYILSPQRILKVNLLLKSQNLKFWGCLFCRKRRKSPQFVNDLQPNYNYVVCLDHNS